MQKIWVQFGLQYLSNSVLFYMVELKILSGSLRHSYSCHRLRAHPTVMLGSVYHDDPQTLQIDGAESIL